MAKRIGWTKLILLSAIVLVGSNATNLPEAIAQGQPRNIPEPLPSLSESSISETKRALIYELLEMTGGRQQHEQIQQIMLLQSQQQIGPMLSQMLQNSTGLSPEEEQAALATMTNNVNALLTDFSAAMQAEITYEEVLEQVYYPVYDQYFTEDDLQGLIEFYETPLGEKLIAVSPGLIQSSMERSNAVFMPRIIEIMDRLIQERLQQSQ